MSAVLAAAAAVLPPTSAAPQGVTLGAPTIECPGHPNNDPASPLGSCNLVFRNQTDLVALTTAQLVETVRANCPGFPNGPYQRFVGTSGAPGQLLSDIDYVTLVVANVNQNTTQGVLPAASIDNQLGGATAIAGEVGDLVVNFNFSSFTTSGATVTITQANAGVQSQVLDLPGLDFVLFEKNQGGGANVGTLVCDLNMFYRTTASAAPSFGLQNFAVSHRVNQITIGWVAGPSGLGSQAIAVSTCNNTDRTNQEKRISYLVGSYEVTATDPARPVNVTGCFLGDDNQPNLARYCDPTEVPGGDGVGGNPPSRTNSCNPEGEVGGGIPSSDLNIVHGSASCPNFSSSGTFTRFQC
jgi:hypothetical protein